MKLTDFRAEHTNGVYAVEKACFSHPWSRADLAAQAENPNARFVVALEGDVVLGYVGLQILCGEGYITNVAVLPAYRRQGVARALLQRAMQNTMDFITLEVRQSNLPAIRLYESLGFRLVGTRKAFYSAPKEDALLYTKFFTRSDGLGCPPDAKENKQI